MANLEPMPISSLPEGSIQDGDKMIIYRDSNGKAYQSDASSMESVAEIKEEVDKLSDDVEQISADLTDLGGRIVEKTNISANTTYRFKFGEAITNGRAIGILYVRGASSAHHLSLFVSGYGYDSARCVTFELTKGSAISYTVNSEIFAIDIVATYLTLTNIIGYFSLAGTLPTIEIVD